MWYGLIAIYACSVTRVIHRPKKYCLFPMSDRPYQTCATQIYFIDFLKKFFIEIAGRPESPKAGWAGCIWAAYRQDMHESELDTKKGKKKSYTYRLVQVRKNKIRNKINFLPTEWLKWQQIGNKHIFCFGQSCICYAHGLSFLYCCFPTFYWSSQWHQRGYIGSLVTPSQTVQSDICIYHTSHAKQ